MNELRADQVFWLWLAEALGPAAPNTRYVLDSFEDSDIHDFADTCRQNKALSECLTPTQYRSLCKMRPEDYFARLDECDKNGVRVVTWGEPDYPLLLRETPAPPLALYYRGDITLPNREFLFAIIGTRRPSAYGVEATRRIAGELAREGAVLVSGLATGLDSECHKAALKADTPTVACLAFGHERCYPAENRGLKELIERQGLVLSEYPPTMPPQRQQFLQRNRLIAGISRGICVAEARTRSGTLNTVRAALEANRDVYSVPGSIFSPLCEGTNQLLAEGAYCARSGMDILRHYSPWMERELEKEQAREEEKRASRAGGRELSAAPPPQEDDMPLSAGAKTVLASLGASSPTSLEVICGKTGLATNKVMAALSELEMAGLILRHGGRQYQLK